MSRSTFTLSVPVIVVVAFATTANAQSGVVFCNAGVSTPTIVRATGTAEPVGDLILVCTGGTSTPAGAPVPQMNVNIFLNTNLTSRTLATNFSEALMLVDEPNTPSSPGVPTLNCGDNGAADNGPSGPGVCTIISTGVSSQTYNGKSNGFGTNVCDGRSGRPAANAYSCGRPNVFQARQSSPPTANTVRYLGIPFDPPGAGTHIFRFTNVRGDASTLGPGGVLKIDISISGNIALSIALPEQTVATAQAGLTFNVPLPAPLMSTVRVTEGFASAFKTKNLSFTVGDGGPGNATYTGPFYTYNGGTHNPADLAQNVPGVVYNSESAIEWRNNGVNGPPSPNPPLGFGGSSVANIGNPFLSAGLGGLNTQIRKAGIANQGTRIALTFTGVPAGHHVTVPEIVHLHHVGSPGVNTGVLVLTKTNDAGRGTFTPTTGASVPAGNFAVYEVLYADPFAIEYADIPCTLTGGGLGWGVKVSVEFAPFYPASSVPANPPIPRFAPGTAAPIPLF